MVTEARMCAFIPLSLFEEVTGSLLSHVAEVGFGLAMLAVLTV